jgi:hypothetical protein
MAPIRHGHSVIRRRVFPGGWYLRGSLVGDPPQIYQRIGDGMAELRATIPSDDAKPLVEFYRRHDHIELWLPIHP